jgi:hypothetical protein
MTFTSFHHINVINDRPGINKCQIQMGLKKAIGIRKAGQGVETVLKNVSKDKNEKNSFCHFSLLKF